MNKPRFTLDIVEATQGFIYDEVLDYSDGL